jgi:hypothetical protein
MRGLDKSSTDIIKQENQTISSNQQPIVDENGMRFLVSLSKIISKKGSNLMFGNDVSKFSLQSEILCRYHFTLSEPNIRHFSRHGLYLITFTVLFRMA